MPRTKTRPPMDIVYANELRAGDEMAYYGDVHKVAGTRIAEQGEYSRICVTLEIGRTSVDVWLGENVLVPVRREQW